MITSAIEVTLSNGTSKTRANGNATTIRAIELNTMSTPTWRSDDDTSSRTDFRSPVDACVLIRVK